MSSPGTDCIQLVPFIRLESFVVKAPSGPYSSGIIEVDPLNGTMDDFKAFWRKPMIWNEVIMDIVFNHTAHDATYTKHRMVLSDEMGNFKNRVGDWWDIADLKIEGNIALQDELLNVLTFWVKQGIDGFRCDVAPLIPLEFWARARKTLSTLNPNLLWVAESVHRGFVKSARFGIRSIKRRRIYEFSISVTVHIFDISKTICRKNLCKPGLTISWTRDDISKNYVNTVTENHDFKRIIRQTKSQLRNLNAMLFLLRGSVSSSTVRNWAFPSSNLFEIGEVIGIQDRANITQMIKTLSQFKKEAGYINDAGIKVVVKMC